MKCFLITVSLISGILGSLISVIELNRHGARTSKQYREITDNLFDMGAMQLTINGYRQEKMLGEYIKNKYKDFISMKIENKAEFFTSSSSRTIFSISGFLAGLYPDASMKLNYENSEKNINTVDTIPIPTNESLPIAKEILVSVVDKKKNSLFHALNCELNGVTLFEVLKKEKKSEIFDFDKNYLVSTCTGILSFFRSSGLNIEDDCQAEETLHNLAEFYFSHIYHFDSKPKKTNNLKQKKTDLDPETLSKLKKYKLNKWYSDRIEKTKPLRLTSSNFLDKIRTYFKSIIDDPESTKYVVYSGHDTLIVSTLSNLISTDNLKKLALQEDGYDFLVPPFASFLLFELHEIGPKKFNVDILYNGQSIVKYMNIQPENLRENKINYEFFTELMEKTIDKDYTELKCLGKGDHK
jgi:hypothetical protein